MKTKQQVVVRSTAPSTVRATSTSEDLLNEMSAPLREKALEIRDILDHTESSLIEARWRLGDILLEIRSNVDHYGADSLRQLGKLFAVDKKLVEDAILFRKHYDKEEVEDLMARRTAKEHLPLTWTHVATIARLPSKRDRDNLLERTVNQSLSTRDLNAAVAEIVDKKPGRVAHGKTSKSKMGRPFKVPKGYFKMIVALNERVNRFRGCLDAFTDDAAEHSLQSAFQELDKKSMTPGLLENVELFSKDLELAYDDLAAINHTVTCHLAYIQKMLGKRKPQATEEVGARRKGLEHVSKAPKRQEVTEDDDEEESDDE